MTRFDRPRLVVVKVGSSSLRQSDGRLDDDMVVRLSAQVAAAREGGTRVAVVSSGAVAAGTGLLGLDGRPQDLPTLQAAAAVGQGALVHRWQEALRAHGLTAAQILLNQDDVVHRHRFLTGRTTLQRLLDLGAVPIINENDAVATEELVYGDNDHLAGVVATMLGADLLLLLSDVEGLMTGDPSRDPDAVLVSRVDDPDALDAGRIGGSSSGIGSGGMRTKVGSASVAVRAGCHAVVADARRDGVVAAAIAGEDVGTWFVAGPQRHEARRLWIGAALTPRGRVVVDDGAVRALRERGTSLLAVGITAVEGDFGAGDLVAVDGLDGTPVARGLVKFGVGDVQRMLGRTTGEAGAELGRAFAREVIHRDDLVVLGSTAA